MKDYTFIGYTCLGKSQHLEFEREKNDAKICELFYFIITATRCTHHSHLNRKKIKIERKMNFNAI